MAKVSEDKSIEEGALHAKKYLEKATNSLKCIRIDRCNAPLCPLRGEQVLKTIIWYPDEEVCTKREFSNLLYIRNQRKIKRRARDRDGYFTYDMLNRDIRISRGIHGLDPDKDQKVQKRKWLSMHKEITAEEREKMRKSARAMYKKYGNPQERNQDGKS